MQRPYTVSLSLPISEDIHFEIVKHGHSSAKGLISIEPLDLAMLALLFPS